MIDTNKLTWYKRLFLVIGFIIVFLIGLGFGQMGKTNQKQVTTPKTTTKKSKVGSQLTEKWVKKFLIAYYTKKDLEENRNRYKEYMTEGMYNATVSEEETAQNQAYKGYVVNFEFQSAQIYIDQTNEKVICYVNYTNDLLQEKDSSEGAQTDVSNTTIIQLTYSKVDKTYLVNNMSTLLITDSQDPTSSQEAYGDVIASNDD
ncbi:hypothetical protein BA718_03240 [Streptococcus gallolyticus subsp. gallolyticus]|uniref:hypothetical protein n=1 Tax=Streptococcus gallolyticus TaxID=315405 RepID=UPI0007E35EA3|nr:hypothetical protein [Streptococcus gallolyticus]OAV83834.1 hypothetical protein A3651_03230 [Streptococcus gallolyticus subsp. gallolyticus]OCW50004.1 hypothetical protein BA718_03240 [Streptococcus gallolyticus subsp. gallolyticus]